MFDVTAKLTYMNVPTWCGDIRRACGNIPIVLCGNKVDLVIDRPMNPKLVTFLKRNKLEYCEISAKSNYNFEKPFHYLANQLVSCGSLRIVRSPAFAPPEVQMDANAPFNDVPSLCFVGSPALAPPEVQMDATVLYKHQADLAAAVTHPLPDDDDAFD